MISDTSIGFENTREFLDRRLRDVGEIGIGINKVTQVLDFGTSQLQSVLKSKL